MLISDWSVEEAVISKKSDSGSMCDDFWQVIDKDQEQQWISTVPWGTPEATVADSENDPSTITRCCLSTRKLRIQLCTGPFTP